MSYCPECLKKDVLIFDLKARIKALQAKLEYQERSGLEAPFGSSTPSAKLPIKPNTPAEERRRRGGGKPGHVGHGRRDCPEAEADRVETIPAGDHCPHCGTALETKGTRSRTVLDCQPLTLEKIVLRLEEKRCPRCHKKVRAKPANVLPRCLFGNQFLTHVAVEHYVRGITLGQLERQLGVGYSSLIAALHFLAGRFESVPERLVKVFRQAPVKHADETGWRNDGHNGYAWLFATPDISLFRFRNTRSASVARELFGDRKLPGLLTLKKRSPDVAAAFKAALDKLAAQPDADPYRILFPLNSS